MNILVIDDMPEYKTGSIFRELKKFGLNFNLNFCHSINSALRYIVTHPKEIDLIILDLGLPLMDDSTDIEATRGLQITHYLARKKIRIPIIINSITIIDYEKELFDDYLDNGIKILHPIPLTGVWLYEFINSELYHSRNDG